MTKSTFTKRYTDYDKKVQEYMGYIADALIEKHAEVPEAFIISLDLLATNLSIMLKATDTMKEEGITDQDKYHGAKKSAPLQTFFSAQSYVNTILSSFGLTPMSKSKMKQNKEEVNVQDFIASLTA